MSDGVRGSRNPQEKPLGTWEISDFHLEHDLCAATHTICGTSGVRGGGGRGRVGVSGR